MYVFHLLHISFAHILNIQDNSAYQLNDIHDTVLLLFQKVYNGLYRPF